MCRWSSSSHGSSFSVPCTGVLPQSHTSGLGAAFSSLGRGIESGGWGRGGGHTEDTHHSHTTYILSLFLQHRPHILTVLILGWNASAHTTPTPGNTTRIMVGGSLARGSVGWGRVGWEGQHKKCLGGELVFPLLHFSHPYLIHTVKVVPPPSTIGR